MLFKRLPDPHDRLALKDFLWGRQAVVVHDRATGVSYAKHTAPLSIKTVRSGLEYYDVHGFPEGVGPDEHLVTNHGQVYRSHIDADTPVETLCIFFPEQDVACVEAESVSDTLRLDDPSLCGDHVEFASVKRRTNATLSKLLVELPTLRDEPILKRQEHSLTMLAALIEDERSQWRQADAIDALRPATKRELYRRCLVGKAYIEAMYAEDISLDRLAHITELSPTHFLRAFAQCFGATPYQALRRRRLDEAAALLRGKKQNVLDVAIAVGYDNLSAFSRAFRAHHGIQPSAMASQ